MRITVSSTLGELSSDLKTMTRRAPVAFAKVVATNAREGNAQARAFASQQHTMNSDIDVPYQQSFSTERLGPLTWAYGPVADGIKHGGSQAVGYERGSRNQKPHLDLARSADIIHIQFGDDVGDVLDKLFWPGAS